MDWYYANQSPQSETVDNKQLAPLLGHFYEQYGQKLVSSDATRRALLCWVEFFQEMTVGEACKIQEQEKFHDWLLNDRNYSHGTAIRFIGVGKAALNWSWKRGFIDKVPYVPTLPQKAAPPKGRPLNVEELGQLLKHVRHQHVLDFIWLMLGTAARPDAIYELTLAQCDMENRLIDLNPAGRDQTKKYRPVVKMPEMLVPLIERRKQEGDCAHLIAFEGRPIKSIRKAWRQLRKDADLGEQVNPYSLRHSMARWLRSQSVQDWEVSAQLGHKKRGMSTTEIYAPFDPTYLSQSVAAIDKLLEQLNSVLTNDDNHSGHQADIQSQEQHIETQTNIVPCQCEHDSSHAKAPFTCESRVKNSHGTEKGSGVNSLIEKEKMVGVRRIELRTSSMSRKRSTTELYALQSFA